MTERTTAELADALEARAAANESVAAVLIDRGDGDSGDWDERAAEDQARPFLDDANLLRAAASRLRSDAARIAELESALDAAHQIAACAPELNMGNYSEDQVYELNNAMIECWTALNAAVRLRSDT